MKTGEANQIRNENAQRKNKIYESEKEENYLYSGDGQP